jgi:type I restriction enzyme R subunit
VANVPVSVVRERTEFRDASGRLVTESVKDFTRSYVRTKFSSLSDFLNRWSKAEQKQAVLRELEQHGLPLGELEEAVGKGYDPFDLILHVAFDQAPLTRRERAERVRKRNYFAKYGPQARKVLDALLEKYADQGLDPVESPDALKVTPFPDIGTPVEIIRAFGGRPKYVAAVRDLKNQLYTA